MLDDGKLKEIREGLEGIPRDAWLIHKSGAFYRANRSGYTTSKLAAGRYSEAEARAEKEHCPEVTIGPAYEWPDTDESFSFDPETVRSLLDRIDSDAKRIRELEAGLEPFAETADDFDGEPGGLSVGLVGDESKPAPEVLVSDLRRARSLLAGEGK